MDALHASSQPPGLAQVNSTLVKIAIDAMGGDLGPRATVLGSAQALHAFPHLELQLFGQQAELEAALRTLPSRFEAVLPRLSLFHSSTIIAEGAKPSSVLRGSENSSMAMALRRVASGQAQASVSAGNTGALMALSRYLLGTVSGISRPAISTAIPTRAGGRCYLLDLGANIEADAARLVDFALMGEIMARRVDTLQAPGVALLNVGVEGSKGTTSVREAHALLSRMAGIDYRGFVEGNGIFTGDVDVVVCDGFVGNAVLKASEGLAMMLIDRVQATFEAHWGSRLVGILARPALRRLKNQLDPVRYNGASLLGLKGIVVKSHGSADATGFFYAVSRALREVDQALPQYLEQELSGRRFAVTSALEGQRDGVSDL